MDRDERVDQRHQAAGDDSAQDPEEPVAQLVRTEHCEERACEHHPLEPDVHDAAALREHAAECGIRQRRCEDEHRREERRPRDDVVEVPGACLRREDAQSDSEDARGDGEPAGTPGAAAERPDPCADREQPEQHRPPRRARGDRRQRDEEREAADDDPADRDLSRAESRPERLFRPGGHQPASVGCGRGAVGRPRKIFLRTCHT